MKYLQQNLLNSSFINNNSYILSSIGQSTRNDVIIDRSLKLGVKGNSKCGLIEKFPNQRITKLGIKILKRPTTKQIKINYNKTNKRLKKPKLTEFQWIFKNFDKYVGKRPLTLSTIKKKDDNKGSNIPLEAFNTIGYKLSKFDELMISESGLPELINTRYKNEHQSLSGRKAVISNFAFSKTRNITGTMKTINHK